ncbi:MAG: outer membrane lipoprotein carrier protein LolA [Bdellovibrionota bacterium]
MIKSINLISFLFSVLLFSAPAAAEDLLDVVSKKYTNAGLVVAQIEKETFSEFLTTPESAKGTFFLSKNLFRLDFDTPVKSSLVYDGSAIWDIQDSGKKVTRYKLGKASESQVLLSTLIDKGSREKNFKLKKKSGADKDIVEYNFESLSKKASLQSFSISILKAKKQISKIEYIDDLANKTTMTFKATEFSKSKKSHLFEFKPTSESKVTDL